jgi:catechol 2,3-dioxygenase-like lactoylglutathione lyase family enzyme
MKFFGPLLVVSDLTKSRDFYETLLGQKLKYDFGQNIMYESGFSIHLKPHYAQLIGVSENSILSGSHNFELFFEEEAFDYFSAKLEYYTNIKYIQRLVEHSWGQRVIRFYDPDMHIIEVGESMKNVVKRFIRQGMSPEEAAEKSQHPLEFVISCLD